MAHTKAQRAVRGNRDSISKRLGVKLYTGQIAKPGNIIIKQRGTKVWAGEGTMLAKDDTVMALIDGKVLFYVKHGKQYVSVVSSVSATV